MRAGRLLIAATLASLVWGCTTLEPPVSPHPKLVATLSSMSAWQVTFIDPARLAEAPVQQAAAERVATRWMAMAGTVVSWAVQVEGRDAQGRPTAPRFGWAVMRGDARDPEFQGDFALDVAIVDAISGELILPAAPEPPPR